MAHQWWGIGVEPADYRDAWLAEGFSEFAGLWYMQQMRRDNEKYFKFLRESGDHLRRSAANAPPIALGYRAIEINPQQYALMIYQKGAWLLHMLRNIMVDFRTMDESRFRAMLRDFYESHRGRRATTRDFQTVVERHVGLSMAWFFQQWWEGTSIPTYVWSWRTDSLDDGGFLLRIRVRQEGVPPGFVMPVPLQIDLPDGHAYVRVYVRDAVTEADLEIPARPLRVVLNPLHSVLAEVKTERWR
jgi:aminopeptidase N